MALMIRLLSVLALWPAAALGDGAQDLAAATVAGQQGDNLLAIRLYSAALAQGGLSNVDRATAYRGRGVASYMVHRWEQSVADYTASLRLDPAQRDALLNRAFAYLGQGDFHGARRDFGEILRADPHNTAAHEGRGDISFFEGHFAEAADDFAATLAVNPDDLHDGLWLYLARQHAAEANVQVFNAWAQTLKDHSWPYAVAEYYGGAIDRNALMARSKTTDPAMESMQQCQLNAYLGADEMRLGHRAIGRTLLRNAQRLCDQNFAEYWLAIVELRR